METVPTSTPTCVNYLQTPCLYKGIVGANCVTTPSYALLGQYCTAASSTVYWYQNGERKASYTCSSTNKIMTHNIRGDKDQHIL